MVNPHKVDQWPFQGRMKQFVESSTETVVMNTYTQNLGGDLRLRGVRMA